VTKSERLAPPENCDGGRYSAAEFEEVAMQVGGRLSKPIRNEMDRRRRQFSSLARTASSAWRMAAAESIRMCCIGGRPRRISASEVGRIDGAPSVDLV